MKESYDEGISSHRGHKLMIKQILAVAWVFAFATCGCYNDHPSDDQTFVCTPGGNDCGEGAECIKAGAISVCSNNQSCRGGCKAPEACVNGTCQCFPSCNGMKCGDDGCGGSCSSCKTGWWCDSGTCKDDCVEVECGESPNLAVNCGTCKDGWLCESGICKDDCAGLECGDSPILGVDCGSCPIGNSWWCNAGSCQDDCAIQECGNSLNLGVVCGTCGDGSFCSGFECIDDCDGIECGLSPYLGVECGNCQGGVSYWCDAGTCKDDCDGLACGYSPNIGQNCGSCQEDDSWCNAGNCIYDCGPIKCGTAPNGLSCGTCESQEWCNAGTCEDDCLIAECGVSQHGTNCGSCPSGFWCDTGTCKNDCTGLECGASPHVSVNCGTCGGSDVCELGTCIWQAGEYTVQCSDGMCLIPAGSFWMGCNAAVDSSCGLDEKPYHQVTLSAYYIDKTEVTVAAYGECVTAGSCTAPSTYASNCNWNVAGKEDHPVNCVTWFQSKAYCWWADKRLPTEAEWEKAARGTDGRKYPWGNEIATCDYAVMVDSSPGCGTLSTMSVCSKSPAGDSPYGLCDMSGNVGEWVSDWYDSTYYNISPSSNPVGPASGSGQEVYRGGAFYGEDGAVSLRASSRDHFGQGTVVASVGVRCARPQ